MPRKTSDLVPAQGSLKGDKDYQSLLQELQSILSKGLYKAYKAVDNIKVQTYWQLGERIVREELAHKERADYGKYLIGNLAVDLDIPRRRLYEIVRFYRVYPIVRSLTAQLSWTHYVSLIEIEDENKRSFYERQAVLRSWSVRELESQIKSDLYESTTPSELKELFQAKLPAIRPQEVFKDTYDFNFTGPETHGSEKDLENKIVSECPMFLKELGEDFGFFGRQVPIKIDGETHFIDLVLYHRGIPCVVLVELKIGKLDSRDIGQMNKYIGYWRRHRQYAHEKDTIGLIICGEAGREEVIYALDGLEEKIFVAEYKVKLPSDAKIKKALREL